jgi:hypothetical protein
MNPAAVLPEQLARYRMALFYLDLVHRGIAFELCGCDRIQYGPTDLISDEERAALPACKPVFLAILDIEEQHERG